MRLHELIQSQESRPLHGSVAFWVEKAQDVDGRLEVDFQRKRDGLSFAPARLIVYIVDANGKRVERSSEPWDQEVNEDLIAVGARAESPSNEVERLGYALKFKLEPVEVRYGDGYFNSMLVRILEEFGFPEIPSVARCLRRISTGTPQQGSSYHNARRDIETALREAGRWLAADLEYDPEAAEQILGDAVAYYLDERFHITNRERLGFG